MAIIKTDSGEMRVLSSLEEYSLLNIVLSSYNSAKSYIAGTTLDDVIAVMMNRKADIGLPADFTEENLRKAFALAGTLVEGKTDVEAMEAVLADGSKIYNESRKAFVADKAAKGDEPSDILKHKSDYADVYRVVEAYKVIMKNPSDFGYTEGMSDDALAKLMANNHSRLPLGAHLMNAEDIKEVFGYARNVSNEPTTNIALKKIAGDPNILSDAYKKYKKFHSDKAASDFKNTEKARDDYKVSKKANSGAKARKFWSVFGRIAMALLVPAAAFGLFSGAALIAGGFAALAGAGSIGIITLTAASAFIIYKAFKPLFGKVWGKLKEVWVKANEKLSGDEKTVGSEKHLKKCKDHLKKCENELSEDYKKDLATYSSDEKLFEIWDKGRHPESPDKIDEMFNEITREKGSSELGGELVDEGHEHDTPVVRTEDTPTELDERVKAYGGFVSVYDKETKLYTTDAEMASIRNEVITEYVGRQIAEFSSKNGGATVTDEEYQRLVAEAGEIYDRYIGANLDAVMNADHRRHATEVEKLDVKNDKFEFRLGSRVAHADIQFDPAEIARRVVNRAEATVDKHRKEFEARRDARAKITGDKERQRYFYHLAAREMLVGGYTIDKDGKITFKPDTKRNSFNEAYVEDEALRNAVIAKVEEYFFGPVGDKQFMSDPCEVEYVDKDGKTQKVSVPMSKIQKVAEAMQSEAGKAAGYMHYSDRYKALKPAENKDIPEDVLYNIAFDTIKKTYYPNYDRLSPEDKEAVDKRIQPMARETMDIIYGRLDGRNLLEHEANYYMTDSWFSKRDSNPFGVDYKSVIGEVVKEGGKFNERLNAMGKTHGKFVESYNRFSKDEQRLIIDKVIRGIAINNRINPDELIDYFKAVGSFEDFKEIIVHGILDVDEKGKPRVVGADELGKISETIFNELNTIKKDWDAHLQKQEDIRKLDGENEKYQALVSKNDDFVGKIIDELVNELTTGKGLTPEQIQQAKEDLREFYFNKELSLVKDDKGNWVVPTVELVVRGVPGLEGEDINSKLKAKIKGKVDEIVQLALKKQADQERFNALGADLGAAAVATKGFGRGNTTFEETYKNGYEKGHYNIFHGEFKLNHTVDSSCWTEDDYNSWLAGIQKDGYYGKGRQIKSDRDVTNEVKEMMQNYSEGKELQPDHIEIEEVEFVAKANALLAHPTRENLQAFHDYVNNLKPEMKSKYKGVIEQVVSRAKTEITNAEDATKQSIIHSIEEATDIETLENIARAVNNMATLTSDMKEDLLNRINEKKSKIGPSMGD